jgi:predicted nuclease with TOPRIM domain
MSTRAARPSPRKQPAAPPPGAEGAGVVQQVLAERRELMIANERLRLELEDLRGRGSRPDPRMHVLELENRALREELAALRGEMEWFQDAVERVVETIGKASP